MAVDVVTAETLEIRLKQAYFQAIGVLVDVMNDAARRPKEALQAAKLLVQKLNGLKLFGKDDKTLKQQRHEEKLLAELKQMDANLERVLTENGRKKPPLAQRLNAFAPPKV